MYEILSKVRRLIPNRGKRYSFYDVGFHGDKYLIQLVDSLIKDCRYFIETGANVGTTLAYMAKTYPHIECISCEPDKGAYREAVKNTSSYTNSRLFNETSQQFISRLREKMADLFSEKCLFWLDAHGYGFDWPLKEEVEFITSNFGSGLILIDDFLVPGEECFKYDMYKGQTCSYDFIKDSICKDKNHRVYYPAYTDRTSNHHPLTGWGLISFGCERELNIPDDLKSKINGPIDFG